jgi:aminoglycoside phosphotransferase family enzyme
MSELPELIQKLLDPEAYPSPIKEIELMQTQMSFVFLGNEYVYKVKKPVNLGYLDYSTLEKRRFFCQREVELNQRLCPDAYLGVVPITRQRGEVFMEGKGKAVEYAVKMRRLPKEAMMDVLLAADKVSQKMVTEVAKKMAEFHQRAETSASISAFGNLDTIVENTEENFSQTDKYIGRTISREGYERISDYTRGFIRENADLFKRRVAEGKIKDCHGDLHAAHVCFSGGICIYDCIEFNDRFRYADVASEIAFLAMDLDNYGRKDLSDCFVDAYVKQSGDGELKLLLNFYKCYRAYVRGKVGSFKIDDPYVGRQERMEAKETASGYFELAESYVK